MDARPMTSPAPDGTDTLPRLGYFVNMYPVPSGTFVRSEILVHEAAGHPIARYAIRPFDGSLVDPTDRAEQDRTAYLLERGLRALVRPTLREAARNPGRFLRALGTAAALALRPGGRHLYNFAYLMEAVRLKALTAQDGIGHLHAHYSTNSATVALLCRRLGGPGYSFTVHGPDELPVMGPNGIKAKLRHARFAVAITDYTRGEILKAAGGRFADKVTVVRCGLDLARFAPAPPVEAGNRRLVCVGRLCPQKAQSRLVEAVARLKDRHPDLRLTLIGDGETRGEIEALIARHGLQEMVHLHGWGTNAEVREAIAASRALVLPSEAEGLPIVLMEAMALGRPAISTRVAGIPELLDATCGWIVPPRDLSALTEALDACLSAPPETLATLAAEGRTRVERHHDQRQNAATLRAAIAARPGP